MSDMTSYEMSAICQDSSFTVELPRLTALVRIKISTGVHTGEQNIWWGPSCYQEEKKSGWGAPQEPDVLVGRPNQQTGKKFWVYCMEHHVT